jgi:hypothetical protein
MDAHSEQHALLTATKRNLNYIAACILQVKTETAAEYLGRAGDALVSKMAAAGIGAGLTGLVSTFGVASTGTAIASLSGAAQTTATFYAIGSWVGGGVAAGVALTGGLSLAAGVLFYHYLKSSQRTEDSFTDLDRRILNTATFLIAQIDNTLAQDRVPTETELAIFFKTVIEPFYKTLVDHQDDLGARLDARNRWALKVNAIIDFEREVVEAFHPYAVRVAL